MDNLTPNTIQVFFFPSNNAYLEIITVNTVDVMQGLFYLWQLLDAALKQRLLAQSPIIRYLKSHLYKTQKNANYSTVTVSISVVTWE